MLREKWDLIPEETDILLTHAPPLGIGDLCNSEMYADAEFNNNFGLN